VSREHGRRVPIHLGGGPALQPGQWGRGGRVPLRRKRQEQEEQHPPDRSVHGSRISGVSMAGRPPISVAVSPSLYPVRESIGVSDRMVSSERGAAIDPWDAL